MKIEKVMFNVEVSESQYGFTTSQLNDLIDYIFDNRNEESDLFLEDIPLFQCTFIINMFHPDAPDSTNIYLYQDELGSWWPYAFGGCLTDVKSIIK